MPTDQAFEVLEHTADVGFRCWGADPAKLFVNAARAMFEISADLSQVRPNHELIFDVGGEDYETLLVNWLNQLVSAFDADEFAPGFLRRAVHHADLVPLPREGREAGPAPPSLETDHQGRHLP